MIRPLQKNCARLIRRLPRPARQHKDYHLLKNSLHLTLHELPNLPLIAVQLQQGLNHEKENSCCSGDKVFGDDLGYVHSRVRRSLTFYGYQFSSVGSDTPSR